MINVQNIRACPLCNLGRDGSNVGIWDHVHQETVRHNHYASDTVRLSPILQPSLQLRVLIEFLTWSWLIHPAYHSCMLMVGHVVVIGFLFYIFFLPSYFIFHPSFFCVTNFVDFSFYLARWYLSMCQIFHTNTKLQSRKHPHWERPKVTGKTRN